MTDDYGFEDYGPDCSGMRVSTFLGIPGQENLPPLTPWKSMPSAVTSSIAQVQVLPAALRAAQLGSVCGPEPKSAAGLWAAAPPEASHAAGSQTALRLHRWGPSSPRPGYYCTDVIPQPLLDQYVSVTHPA
ncbi:putative serine/threonine-protein phosphatase 4 regulatory subunit 1-like [Manis javanica]|nr:putative serine/threonine-protein phosphatase 4 regulatory subunit 1-like [Manis javanica]